MAITYNRTNWQNKVTPVNETNMNNIEQGIVDCAEAINAGSGSTITVDDTLSATSENPVQNKVIYNALGEKLDIIPISLTSTTVEERRTEFLTTIRSNFTENGVKYFLLTNPRSLKFELHYDAIDGSPEYDLTATFAGLISVLYFANSGEMVLQGFTMSTPYMVVDGSNNLTLIAPAPMPTISYNLPSQPYRPVALNTMKLYVADAPDTISTLVGTEYTFDFSKGQMLTANIEGSANTTLIFGVTGNNNAKYVGRTISACITNTSTSAARTITFDSPTGITRVVGVEGGSADSLSVPALKTVKLNATLLKTAAGFVVYIEYKQIN